MDRQMGPNVLWLCEALAQRVELAPGMKVLDLGCGKALSSVFLAREYGVEVWAADLWVDAGVNAAFVEAEGLADAVHPLNTEAHSLPFAPQFFDAIVSIDAYQYFGTDDLYLGYVLRFLKPGGPLAAVVAGFDREPEPFPPPALRPWWDWSMACWHSPDWWRTHWERSGLVDVELAEVVPNSHDLWLQWEDAYQGFTQQPDPTAAMLAADRERLMAFVLLVARNRARA